jgi:hypothetical protein
MWAVGAEFTLVVHEGGTVVLIKFFWRTSLYSRVQGKSAILFWSTIPFGIGTAEPESSPPILLHLPTCGSS